jgi:ABC-type Fe3+ transport system permease subunit
MADVILIIHFLWILFILAGFVLTVCGVVRLYIIRRPAERWNRFFDRWLLRTVHMSGILFTACLELLGKYCPLTVWEYTLREPNHSQTAHPDPFIITWLERLVYPSIHPLVIIIPTLAIALFTLAVYILRPPQKIKNLLRLRRIS